jgi:hypothetical protein
VLQDIVRALLNRNHPPLKVYVDNFFHLFKYLKVEVLVG